MMIARQRPVFTILIVFIVFVLFYFLAPSPNSIRVPSRFAAPFSAFSESASSTSSRKTERPYGKDYKGHSTPVDINRVTNSTLGFAKVFVVGLPERSDKRDAIALTASLTGFDIEWIDGVRGETIPDKAVPFGIDRKKLMETNLGSWRGHMNAIRRIVEEGLDSALIMEDDMDWDVRLKPQLELVAAGARTIMEDLPDMFFPTGRPSADFAAASSSYTQPRSPYGDDWDILWLGHCGEPFPEKLDENKNLPDDDAGKAAMSRKYTILNDATVPPLSRITGIVDFKTHRERTRWVHVTAAPICTFAYAVSQRGARKVLYDLSVNGLDRPFDNALAWLCRRAVGGWSRMAEMAASVGDAKDPEGVLGDRGLDAKCMSVTPPVFFHHKAKGNIHGDSDIQVIGDKEQMPAIREKGTTENIVWSARLNIMNMIMGAKMDNQF